MHTDSHPHLAGGEGCSTNTLLQVAAANYLTSTVTMACNKGLLVSQHCPNLNFKINSAEHGSHQPDCRGICRQSHWNSKAETMKTEWLQIILPSQADWIDGPMWERCLRNQEKRKMMSERSQRIRIGCKLDEPTSSSIWLKTTWNCTGQDSLFNQLTRSLLYASWLHHTGGTFCPEAAHSCGLWTA